MSQDIFDVLVIGGGLSGLSAAYELYHKNRKLKFIILEAKERIGGRTLGSDLKIPDGKDSWDLGGQWIGRCQQYIFELVRELELETYAQYTEGRKLVQLDGAGSIIQYTSDIPPISILSVIELQCFIWKVCRFMKKMESHSFMTSELASKLDNITLEQYKHAYFWTQGAKNILDSCCRCIFGSDPKHMSLLYFLLYAYRSNNFEALLSCKQNFGAQELKIKGGAWQVCHHLLKRLPDNSLHLSSPVISIDQSDKHQVCVRTTGGDVFVCRNVILAIPPNEIIKISFKPCLPLQKFDTFQRMPVGYLTKIIVTYAEAFWRRKGYSGEVLSSGANGRHPLCVVFDGTSANNNAALVAFVGGTQQISFASLQEKHRKSLVLETLASFFGPEALEATDYVEKNWNEEPYNGGCPVNVATPGISTTLTLAFSQPFLRLHFAGTESATSWCGFLNGAVQAGKRAAHEVLFKQSPESLDDTDLHDTCYAIGKTEDHAPTSRLSFLTTCVAFAFIAVSLFAYKHISRY